VERGDTVRSDAGGGRTSSGILHVSFWHNRAVEIAEKKERRGENDERRRSAIEQVLGSHENVEAEPRNERLGVFCARR